MQRNEIYTIGYSERLQELMARRTAADCAGFFLPHLRPGMTLLDCGCGTGSITLGLAKAVEPGIVIGVDCDSAQIQAAASLAERMGVSNVRFEQGSAYQLPFASSSFDAALAHSLLVHLRDPLSALRELRRVLNENGVVGVVDSDFGARIWNPSTPLFDRFQELLLRVLEHNGASLYYARRQRSLLNEAGFSRTVAYASSLAFGTPEATRVSAAGWEECLTSPRFVQLVLEQGWVDQATLDAMRPELRAWAERPDAFNAILTCSALGWCK